MLVFQPNPVVTKLFSYINAGHVSENSLSPGSKECSENMIDWQYFLPLCLKEYTPRSLLEFNV